MPDLAPDAPTNVAPLKRMNPINDSKKGSNFELKSQLHGVIDAVNGIPDFEGKKAKALELIGALNMNESDKRKMLMILQYQCPNAFKLTQYLYNAMLKFEGLGSVAKKRDF